MEHPDQDNMVATDTETERIETKAAALSVDPAGEDGAQALDVSEQENQEIGAVLGDREQEQGIAGQAEQIEAEFAGEQPADRTEGEKLSERQKEKAAALESRLDEARAEVLALFVDYKDDEDHANDVGVSFVFDDYHREILEPVFENILRMSENTVKLAYSRLKNTFLSYKEVAQRYEDQSELFLRGNKILAMVELSGKEVVLHLRLDPKTLDKKEYPHKAVTEKPYHNTPVCVHAGKDIASVKKAVALIEKLLEEEGLSKKRIFVPTAYAERYPLNPEAVLRGREYLPPVDGEYDTDEYEYIVGELSGNLLEDLLGDRNLKEKKGKQQVETLRQNADTIKGATALTEPIVYFYNAALNFDSTVAYVNVQQVLNDKFLGKILPQQFFAVAEGSDRIEELNLFCLKEIAGDCGRNPKWKFAVPISCRMLTKDTLLKKVIKAGATEHKNMILSFDSALLSALGDIGVNAILELRNEGFLIMADNTENATVQFVTDFDIDYLRFDGRYYKEGELKRTAHLQMLTGYAKVQGIVTAAVNVENIKEAKHLLTNGVEVIEGEAVGSPKRIIAVATKEIRKLPLIGS